MEIKPLFKTKEAMSVCIFFADWTRGCRVKNREMSKTIVFLMSSPIFWRSSYIARRNN